MNTKTILKILLVLAIISVIAGYAYYKSKNFVIGPEIEIISPQNGSSVNKSLLEIIGTAKNISYITLNDRPIFTNEKGEFKEKLLLFPGYNIISIKAKDNFKRKTNKTLEIIYNAPVKKTPTTTLPTTKDTALVNQTSTSTKNIKTSSTTSEYNSNY